MDFLALIYLDYQTFKVTLSKINELPLNYDLWILVRLNNLTTLY